MIIFKTPIWKYRQEFIELEVLLNWLVSEQLLEPTKFESVKALLKDLNNEEKEDALVLDFEEIRIELLELQGYLNNLPVEVEHNRDKYLLIAVTELLNQYIKVEEEYVFYAGYTEDELRTAIAEIKRQGTIRGVQIRGKDIERIWGFDTYGREEIDFKAEEMKLTLELFEETLEKYFRK